MVRADSDAGWKVVIQASVAARAQEVAIVGDSGKE